jgi:Amt family ammonium transporter
MKFVNVFPWHPTILLGAVALLSLFVVHPEFAHALQDASTTPETKQAETKTESAPSETKSASEEKAADSTADTKTDTDAKDEKTEEEAVAPPTVEDAIFRTNNLWILIAAFLVFIMHLGFATLESGLTQQKNTVNILFKNTFIVCAGILTYYIIGFNMHYPGTWFDGDAGKIAADASWNGFFSFGYPAGYASWFAFLGLGDQATAVVADQTIGYTDGNYTYWTDFLFQAMFAATAATIVSGAVAERVKLGSFMVFATLLVGVAYPIAGSWHWGTGYLHSLGFVDFAGSTVVHAFGGAAALACVLLLGARKGKYTKDGMKPILGHSMPLATIGVFLLWLGWFGFNGGSVLSADPATVSLVSVTTTLAAASGALGSIATAWILLRKPDLSMSLNGVLAGLVGITAGADIIAPRFAILTGFLAGILVVLSILALDRLRIDDPVGAVSVHGVCGIFGTLCCAFFGGASLLAQLAGIGLVCGFAFIFSLVVFGALKYTIGIRVSEEVEFDGLDVHEHGSPAYVLH